MTEKNINYKVLVHFYASNTETFIGEWTKQRTYTKGNTVSKVDMTKCFIIIRDQRSCSDL